MSITIITADATHADYAQPIADLLDLSAQQRGTGIAKRSPLYLLTKILNGNAVIALDGENLVGFCYIERWEHGKYVANSGLVVHPDYRNMGIAKKIKLKVFQLSKEKYPEAKIFGITTSLATMKINSELGYKPVTFSELTRDEAFWAGCQGCKNFDILQRNNKSMCLCTGMLYQNQHEQTLKESENSRPYPSSRLRQKLVVATQESF